MKRQQEGDHLQARERPRDEIHPGSIPSLDFQPSDRGENKCLLLALRPVVFRSGGLSTKTAGEPGIFSAYSQKETLLVPPKLT